MIWFLAKAGTFFGFEHPFALILSVLGILLAAIGFVGKKRLKKWDDSVSRFKQSVGNPIPQSPDRSFLGSSPKRLEPTFLNGNPSFRNAFLSCLGESTRPQSRTLAPREETTARRSVKSNANPA
jgi:hypothetical protein